MLKDLALLSVIPYKAINQVVDFAVGGGDSAGQ